MLEGCGKWRMYCTVHMERYKWFVMYSKIISLYYGGGGVFLTGSQVTNAWGLPALLFVYHDGSY